MGISYNRLRRLYRIPNRLRALYRILNKIRAWQRNKGLACLVIIMMELIPY